MCLTSWHTPKVKLSRCLCLRMFHHSTNNSYFVLSERRFRMAIPKIPKINITCGSTDCQNDHHAFNDPSHTYKKRGRGRNHLDRGVCKACGIDIVDWDRLHKRDLKDAA